MALFYGAQLALTPQLQHLVRILGAFMIAIGVLAGMALSDPERNRAIIYGLIVLLLLRVSQRLLFAQELHEHFAVSYAKLWVQSLFFIAIGAGLFLLRPRPRRSP